VYTSHLRCPPMPHLGKVLDGALLAGVGDALPALAEEELDGHVRGSVRVLNQTAVGVDEELAGEQEVAANDSSRATLPMELQLGGAEGKEGKGGV
jgi:hypothetical protein